MIERHFRRYSSFSHPEPSPEIFDASINESSSLIPPSSIESTNGCIEEGHFLARDSVSVASTNFKAESIPCGGSGRKVRPTAVNYQIVNPPAISALQASPIADELVSRGSSNSFNNIYQLYQHPQHLRNLRSL